ncbi:MAG: DNA polymerase III subunit alpha [Neomegalonema sp.]|nr:DNA polymerase III subunit alpha [Neomegalonema sp.]
MERADFIHLRVHSAYSMLEGAVQIKKLPGLCEGMGMPALGIADTGNLFGALEFSETLAKAGIQPIIGCQLDLAYAPPPEPGQKPTPPAPILLYAQSELGYRNLMKIVSHSFLDCGEAEPFITWAMLEEAGEGLLCLTGGARGPAGIMLQNGKTDRARAHLEQLAALFPDRLYVEISRHGFDEEDKSVIRTAQEEASEEGFLDLAYALDLPIVAVNEIFFPKAAMFEAHDAMLCIADGRYVSESDRRQVTPAHFFKTPAQMKELFADLPEAIENTIEIAQRCAYRPRTHPPILPKFADDEVAELRRQANEGLERRLAQIEPAASRETYQERLDYELGIIEKMGFPGYFLIVADFIKWAKDNGIPVGPGRGSGAGSLVAYVLTITNLDPLRYALLFERFLNPERVSMPDFDIDFCQDRREEVIRYVQDKYGHDKVAQIITFGALLSKVAVRDVGRVLQMSYGQVDRLSKLIPVVGVKPMSISEARAEEPRLNEEARQEPVVGTLLDIAEQIEGLLRNASTHAAGVVIGDRPLEQLVPLYRDPRSDMPVTQFNMKWVEPAGLVKFDFLGLKTLTVIQNALDLLKLRGIEIDIEAIPIDDKKTYELYGRAETVAVFQVESSGMRDALRQLQPTCIEDIVALVALYRPGPMENIPKYCNVKHGREAREKLHPSIDHILDETQGIIVYQEQVMQIAQEMAGYTLGGADLLRRAMGKKIKEAMDAERPKFVEGAKKTHGVADKKAVEVFDLLEKFANYGFNKSHAAAYGYVSYQTGYLKANFPVEFMAAVMNLDMHLTDKLGTYAQELRRMDIPLLPPDLNTSLVTFSVESDAQGALCVRYALGALKNVGSEAVKLIVEERAANGAFTSVFDLAQRVPLKLVGKRVLEMLARAGAFDSIDSDRRKILESVDTLVAYSATHHAEAASAQESLFGGAGVAIEPPRLAVPKGWTPTERLTEEAAAVGFYISGHPLDDYLGALRRKRILTYAELCASVGGGLTTRIAGMVLSRQERKSQKGTLFAFVQFSDPSAMFEAVVFSETLLANRDKLEPGAGVVLSVEAEKDGDQVKLRILGVQAIDEAVADAASSGLRLFVEEPDAFGMVARNLTSLLGDKPAPTGTPPRGFGPVNLVIGPGDKPWEAEIALPGYYPVNPQVRGALKGLPGVRHVEEF